MPRARRLPRIALRERLRTVPLPLRILLVVAAIEALAWTAVLAPLQGPDESAHYSYAQYFAETGHKPQLNGGTGTVSKETGGAYAAFNLYSLVGRADARPFWSPADVRAWRAYDGKLPASARKNGSGPNSIANNPPLYYAYEAIPYRAAGAGGANFLTRLFVMRLWNALLFLATVAFTWLIAAELFRSVLLRTVATACVVLLPTLAFMAGVVNADSMLTAIWAAFLLVAVRLVLRGPSALRVVGLFALCAASLLTHGRGLPLVPVTLLALLLAWNRHRPPLRQVLAWVAAGVAVMIVALAVYAAVRTGSGGGAAYGGEAKFGKAFSLREFVSFVWQFYFPKLPFMTPRIGPDYGFRQMFIERYLAGSFGSLEVIYSQNVYRLVQVAAELGLIALVYALVSRRHPLRERWDVLLLLASLVVCCLGLLHLASYRALVGGGGDPLIVGRYLMPLTPVFGLAVAFVVSVLRPRMRAYAAALLMAAGLLLQLGGLGLTLVRFYG